MTERFIPSDNPRQLHDNTSTGVSDELLSIEHDRDAVYGVAGCINAEVVNQSLDMLRRELSADGAVKERIEVLKGYITVVERRLAQLDVKRSTIQQRMIEPQKVHDWASSVLEEIDERKTNLAQRIQDLQKEKTSKKNRDEINRLQHEQNYSEAALHHQAWNARINASADLNRLKSSLASVVANRVICLDRLSEYQGEARELGERLTEVSAALGVFVIAMAEVNVVSRRPFNGEDVPPPELPPDIDIDAITRPISYGDYPSFVNHDNKTRLESFEHPANTLEFMDAVSVEMAIESVLPEELKQPESLGPLLREKAIEAQSAPRLPKKRGRINNLLNPRRLRV